MCSWFESIHTCEQLVKLVVRINPQEYYSSIKSLISTCICTLNSLGFILVDLPRRGFPDDDEFFADSVDPWDQTEESPYDNIQGLTAAENNKEDSDTKSYLVLEPDGEFDEEMQDAGEEDDGYLAVNPEWLEEQWKLLSVQPWFRGNPRYTRDDATSELISAPPGSFVVRISQSQPGHYAISAKVTSGKIISMLILPSWAGRDSNAPGKTQYRLGSTSKLLFNTVPRLIKYFTENFYYKQERLRGSVVSEQQEGGYMLLAPTS
eukprot:gene10819-2899_t